MVIWGLLRFTKDPFIGVPTFRIKLISDVSKLRHVPDSVIGKVPDLGHAKRLTKRPAFLRRRFWYFGTTGV